MKIENIREILKTKGVYNAIPVITTYCEKMITLAHYGLDFYYEMIVLTDSAIHDQMTFGDIAWLSDIEYLSFTVFKTEQSQLSSIKLNN